ncbi:Hydroxyacylglutathione hydrolase GloC [subsurface metagenome]
MITIKTFVFNSFQENTYIVFDETNSCVIIDPGMNTEVEEKELHDYISEHKLIPEAIVNTHCHVDHVLGCNCVKNTYEVPFYAHESEKILIDGAKAFAEFFGMKIEQPLHPDYYLQDGSRFTFGESELEILHVPGHSPGSLVFFSKTANIAITGDVLFKGSIGRTDLPGGNLNLLIDGIKSKLLTLPPEVAVFPGHGPHTTIGHEHDTNPFLK